MSWEDVPLYWPRDKKETFQVILNVDGSIIFQYKDLQHVDSYVKAGIEDERGKEGIGISQTSLANGKAYEIVRVVQKLESPPAEKVTITSKTSYAYGNGQLVAKLQEEPINSAPKIYYYHNDHLGSARVISDKDGKVVEQYFYYPFGGGGPVGGPTFTGKELDDSGLFYFGARYYDPALGRFITPDSVQIPADNLYVYCANNPLTNIDPNGEFWQFIWAAWKFYTAVKTLYNVYEAYQYGGWDAALMSAGSSWMFNQFSAGISAGINFGDWGGPLGDIFELGVEGAITGGISSLMYGGDFWEGARTGAISGVGSGIANALLPILGAVPTAEKETIISDPVDPTDFLGAGKIVVGGIKTVLVGGGKVIGKGIGKIGGRVIGKGAAKEGVTKAQSPVWKEFKTFRGGIKTSGKGRNKEYYKWDHTHNHIEVYDRYGNHKGVMDPITGVIDRSKQVPGRTIKDEL